MRRLVALLAVAGAVAFAAPAEAKPFSYSDPRDMPAHAGLDIVSVSYATEGTTSTRKVRGRTVRTYEPTKLVVTMTLAGAPLTEPGVRYRSDAQIDGCGWMSFWYSRGAANDALPQSWLNVGCGGPAGTTGGDTLFIDPKFTIKGSKLSWTVPLKALPKNARAGALLFDFRSSVDVVDPAFGFLGPDDAGDGIIDSARSDADWEIG